MSEKKDTSIKSDNIKNLFNSFVNQAKELGLPLNMAVINLEKENANNLSGNFNIKTGSIEDLNKSLLDSEIDKRDIVFPQEVSTEKNKSKKMKFK